MLGLFAPGAGFPLTAPGRASHVYVQGRML